MTDFDPNDDFILSLLESIMMVGSAIGCAVIPLYASKLGLSKSLLLLFILNAIINIVEPIPVHWIYLVVMRGISGFLSSQISTVSPLLMAIMLNPKKRAKAVMYESLAINGGITIAYVINLLISFKIELYWLMFLF